MSYNIGLFYKSRQFYRSFCLQFRSLVYLFIMRSTYTGLSSAHLMSIQMSKYDPTVKCT